MSTQPSAHPRREYTPVWDGKGTTNIGQKVGSPKGAMLYDPDLETTVIVCWFRSAHKNQQVANDLLDLVAMEPRWTGDKGDSDEAEGRHQ